MAGDDLPPDDAYGRVTNPHRFAILHDAARGLIDDLVEQFDVQRTDGVDLDPMRLAHGRERRRRAWTREVANPLSPSRSPRFPAWRCRVGRSRSPRFRRVDATRATTIPES
jgi:hypothetical protein